jgi:hypothetical protein
MRLYQSGGTPGKPSLPENGGEKRLVRVLHIKTN